MRVLDDGVCEHRYKMSGKTLTEKEDWLSAELRVYAHKPPHESIKVHCVLRIFESELVVRRLGAESCTHREV